MHESTAGCWWEHLEISSCHVYWWEAAAVDVSWRTAAGFYWPVRAAIIRDSIIPHWTERRPCLLCFTADSEQTDVASRQMWLSHSQRTPHVCETEQTDSELKDDYGTKLLRPAPMKQCCSTYIYSFIIPEHHVRSCAARGASVEIM